MALFRYTAYRSEGEELISGSVTAETPREARERIRQGGLHIAQVSEVRDRRQKKARGSLRGKRSARRHATEFFRELSTLLSVGLPLVEALDTVRRDDRSGRFSLLLHRVRDRLSAGASLAESLAEEPHAFDELSLSMVSVGERTGHLADVLSRLADFKERSERLRGRLSGALIYPVLVLVVAVFVSILLMTVVVPGILEPILASGAEIPWITRWVKQASDFLLAHWAALALALIVCCATLTILLRTTRGRRAFHRLLLSLPVLGPLLRKQLISRFALVLSALLRSGIAFLEALRIAKKTVPNLVLRDALGRVEDAVTTGRSASESLEETRAVPSTVVQVFSLGQESGTLESLLEKLAEGYDLQVQMASQKLSSALEPVLILTLAVLVGAIAFATILPILEAGHVL